MSTTTTTTGRPPPPRISLPWTREINAKHAALGGDSGLLGAPVEGFNETPNRRGWYRHYRHGSIYWTRETGAHEVHGMIRARWEAMGWENSRLGFPTSDELPCADKAGRLGNFEGGVILWSPSTGAHEVYGDILGKYRQLGLERSFLGYPTGGEMDLPLPEGGGRCGHFQRGQIAWSPARGAGVSFTSYDPATGSTGPGGVRLTGLPGSGVPEIRRRLVCRASLFMNDDEPFWDGGGIPETGRLKALEDRLITSDLALDVLKMVGRVGGELRVELVVNAQARPSGDVLVKARAVLFEGDSEHSKDRDGDEDHTALVPRDGKHRAKFRVNNEDEGGDFGAIDIELENLAA